MDNKNKQILAERFQKMPNSVQSYFTSGDFEDDVMFINSKNDVGENLREEVENSVLLSIFFITEEGELVNSLTKLGITNATKVYTDVDNYIYSKVYNLSVGNSSKSKSVPLPIPKPGSAAKPPIPKPGMTANPTKPVVASDKVVNLNEVPQKEIPTGKMVGLKKENPESTVKGMRTMRGDINRLRGPETEGEPSKFTEPFTGK